MSLNELQSSIDQFSGFKAILWCFYPMTVVVALELIARTLDDDDDHDGGQMIPALQGNQ